jgi:amino acid adenylation domain-containing protein
MTETSRFTGNLLSDEVSRLTRHPPGQQEPVLKFAPLSLAQHQVWLSEQLEPGGTGYHIADVYRLSGLLQPRILEQAFNEIVRRHEALRTTFTMMDDEAVQVIHPELPLKLTVVDLSHLTGAECEAAGDEHVLTEATRPFDLTSGPLLRPTLVRLGEQEHLLSLVTHHIVSDGWSLGVLLRELGQLYAAFVRGEPNPLPELPVQYADFAAWQREWLGGEALERHLGYWRGKLAGVPALLELPTDRPRPAARSARGGRLSRRLPEGLTVRLRELSRCEGATLFMVLLAAFKTLLARYAGCEDVVVGTPVAGHSRTDFEGLIGLFVNTLVLRTDLSGEPSFLDALKRVRDGFLDAHEHQDVPIEMLVGDLRIERSLSHTPLVQVLFNMLNFSASAFELPGVEARRLSPPETGSKFDLTLYARDDPRGLALTLVYSTDLFEETRMLELLGQFEHLLEQVVAHPHAPITQHSLLTGGARKLLPDPSLPLESEWSGAAHTLLSTQASLSPEGTALADARRTWTYRELDERSNQLAHRLLAAGLQRRDLVAIYAHRSAPLVWAMFGVLKAGAAFVILDPAYPEQRLVEYLRVAKPSGLLHVAAAGELPPAVEAFLAEKTLLCRLKLHPSAAAEARGANDLPPAPADGVSSDLPDSLANYPTAAPAITIRPSELAYLAFTSGSTGQPKAVMGTHGSLTHYHVWMQKTFGVGGADRFSMISGLSHDPLLRDIFTPLLLGAALHVPDPALFGLPGQLARWMKDAEITVTNLTPAMGQMLDEFPGEEARLELTQLRHAFFVGDVLTRRDVARFRRLAPSAACVNLYGATETQRALAYHVVPVEQDDGDEGAGVRAVKEVLPVGRGVTAVQLLVLNPQRHLAGVGEPGEIYFRSPYLAKGYLGDPLLTRARFVLNPFTDIFEDRLYKTGDLGRYLPDGNVELLGRVDLQVKIRGFRVELGEVESALREFPGVGECVVVMSEGAAGDRRLVGYLVMQGGLEERGGNLREHLRKRLPDYMIPYAFVFMEKLPVTPNGKVDRGALPAPGETTAQAEGDDVAPQTPVGEAVAEIWRRALNLNEVRPRDNFFELGGHSLLVLRVLARVRKTLQVEIPFRSLFEAPTLGAFAERVEAAMRDASDRSAVLIEHIPQEAEPALSLSQEGWLLREWWEEVHAIRRRLFQMGTALRVTGPLDLGLLEQALAEVTRRHDILRATFPKTKSLLVKPIFYPVLKSIFALKAIHSRLHKLNYKAASNAGALKFAGGRKLVIRPQVTPPLTFVDLQDVSEAEREAEITKALCDHTDRPFDYAKGPLLRVIAVRLSAQEHVVSFVLHHLICDGWSMRVFLNEVLTLYHALAEGRPSPLPELPIQFTDFARWQRAWLHGDNLQKMVAYWEERFSGTGLFPQVSLPFARARRPGKITNVLVEVQSLTIPFPLLQSLRGVCYARGVTTYMLFMASLGALLHHYTETPEIGIHTPFANRSRVEAQGLIGWFANVHVLNVDCSGNPTFAELLGRVRDVVLGAYAHQDVPYLMIVKTLLRKQAGYQMPRSVSEVPHVILDYITQSGDSQQVGPLTVSRFPLPPSSDAQFVAGLDVRVLEQAEQLVVTIRYSPDVFEPARISRILAELRQLLHGVVDSPEEHILDIPLA